MSYFGLILLAWLFVGFVTGLKVAWADDRLNAEFVAEFREKILKESEDNEQLIHLYDVVTKKRNFIAVCTLLGFIVAILEVKGMTKRMKERVKKVFKK